MMRKNKKNGFTLVECLVAISILIIGILSSFILVTKALYNATVIQDRLTASFLAQEGIELVRNIRDTNFIQSLNSSGVSWRNGLGKGEASDTCYTIDAFSPKGITLESVSCNSSRPLKYYKDQNIYNYQTGEDTPFYREIKIEEISDDEIRVISHLKWKTKNTDFDLEVEDHLYNWFKFD
ncbi:MAG TPA: prepilin-type N-terminal cleavage/methylation domain-containing protein [Candidatus Paceibacterota bacterium]|nr:prepilin-type N-terminal cleavage/methylation domain-containing protein [Candidatus Paceibacterota bacterium]